MNRINLVLIVVLGVLAAVIFVNPAGCSNKPSSNLKTVKVPIGPKDRDGLPTMNLPIGPTTFTLEVADTDPLRERGLMFRTSMPEDHGMIFVFPEERDRGFWMENTLIPLDILYLDAKGTVVSIKTMKPKDRTSVPSDGPAMYAIELNAGVAAKTGVKPGDVIPLPPGLKGQ
jgi:uncharacterized protein